MKSRRLFDPSVLEAVSQLFENAWEKGVDFGFQQDAESAFCQAFAAFQGGGYSDAVSSGSVAVYLALLSLELPPGSEVIVSPVTDPGCLNAVILAGHLPVVADAARGHWNTCAEEIRKVLSSKTRAALLTHSSGLPLDLDPILSLLARHEIPLLEDASQATGATYRGRRVGTFGKVAAFSTMFSKTLATGGCGGLVYTRDEAIYWRLRSLADRGKNFQDPQFNPKDPTQNLFPSLNYNADEIQCTIGLVILERLPEILRKRRSWASKLEKAIQHLPSLHLLKGPETSEASPFFLTLLLNPRIPKRPYTDFLVKAGIGINADYRYVLQEWPWAQPYFARSPSTPNALMLRKNSFNILFHEQYGPEELQSLVSALERADQFAKPFLEGESDEERRKADSKVPSCHL